MPKLFILLVALNFVASTGHKFEAVATAHPQTTVISDTLFNPNDWSVVVESEFGDNETHEQRLTGGNPGCVSLYETLSVSKSCRHPAEKREMPPDLCLLLPVSLSDLAPAIFTPGNIAGVTLPPYFEPSWEF